eukprot:TRINITY_DN10651_c0_g1_i1.p1 TRINITY_DN10651_c0_g1~~TRINITY_DN10651_c0_g1_i1.p1  ORF type:complete len:174 (-),score=7.13 TRINITY_DN10651_c0_g1_i1:142-627(-)
MNGISVSLKKLSPTTENVWYELEEEIIVVKRMAYPTPYHQNSSMQNYSLTTTTTSTTTSSATDTMTSSTRTDSVSRRKPLGYVPTPKCTLKTIRIGNVSVIVQTGPVGFAHATSGVIRAALNRIYNRRDPNPTREELLKTICDSGIQGTANTLSHFCPSSI